MKRQKHMILEDESPRSAGVQYATGESREIPSERIKCEYWNINTIILL